MEKKEKEEKSEKVKNVVLAVVIATVFLIAAIGSASAVTVMNSCNFEANTPGEYYVLGSNLTCNDPDGACTIIGADGVTIDGYNTTDNKYYSITGNRGASDCHRSIIPIAGPTCESRPANHSAIVILNRNNVVIKNLEIKNFCTGIALQNSINSTVTGCKILDNGVDIDSITHGIHLVNPKYCNITKNGIYNNTGTGDGCSAGGDGIFYYGEGIGNSNYNNITCNNIHNNRKAGIFMKMKPYNNTISHNNIWENGEAGAGGTGGIILRCKLCNYNHIAHNNASNNFLDGIYIGGLYNTIEYNIVNNNSDNGIDIGRGDGGDYNELYHNTVCDNGAADIVTCGPECYGNHGDDNTCNTTLNYDDDGTSRCTFECGLEEGACVGATQCFTCGDTVTESCTLNGDMSCAGSGGIALTIGADDIIIDGAGYELVGNNYGWGMGIKNFDHGGIVVKNLNINKFYEYGIWFSGGYEIYNPAEITHIINCVIENCTVHDIGTDDESAQGMYLKGMSDSTIKSNEVYNVRAINEDDCESGGNGIFFFGGKKAGKPASQHNNITYNWLHDNQKAGFFTKMMLSNSTISHNNASRNSWSGILDKPGGIVCRCKKTDNNVVEYNTLSNNYGDGLYVGGCSNTIKYNTVLNNSNLGIDMGRSDGSDYNELYHNLVCENGAADIVTCGPDYGNHGDCNTCNSTSNYDDDGATDCTFQCGVDEGACVGATQCFMCGDTVTESCTFNGDMSCSSGHGLVVGAEGIVIDGNGFAIDGVSLGTTYRVGIYNYDSSIGKGHDDVVIRNMEIKNFCDGIRLKGEWDDEFGECVTNLENNTIDNCVVHHNGVSIMKCHGIRLKECVCNSTIKNCIVHNNTGKISGGCEDGGVGIHLHSYCNYNKIVNNTIYGNRLAGIFSKMVCQHNYVAHNEVYENGHSNPGVGPMCGGIRLQCVKTNHWTVEHNKVTDNFGPGIYTRGRHNRIGYNIVSGSKNVSDLGDPSGWGLGNGYYSCGSGNTLFSNTFCDNEVEDISVLDTQPVTGSNNTCNTTKNYDDDGTTGCTYTCPGETDLTITAKYEQWFGEIYNVIYTIKNLGHSTAPESITGIYVDTTLAKTDPVGLIGPGVSYVKTVGPFTMSGNEDAIKVCADNEHVINEINETNNCLENVFTGVVIPDLVITGKSEEWVDLGNKTYNITYTVKNIGNANANESSTSIYINGVFNTTDFVGALPQGADYTNTLGPFTMSGESDMIRICADNESAVEESNEDNNCLQNTFEHPGIPDLVVTRKYEEWVASNDIWRNYTVTYTVKNIGTGDAGASTTSITIDGAEVENDSVEALGEGDSYTNTLGPFNMTDESDTIKVCADKDNVVEESNEDNNCTENTFDYSEAGCLAEDGTLFMCGNIVTKNCTLNGDMSCPFTDGLKIGANSITINGNNSVLDGAGCTLDALRSGVYNQGYDEVTIKDLEVKGFCHGMYLYGTGAEGDVYRNTIEHCDIHHSGNASTTAGLFGITMKYVYNSTIRNNSVHHQIAGVDPNPSCEDGGNGMFLYKGNYNNFTYNDVYNNTKGGIFIKMQPMHNNISHNDLWDNGQGGIILRCMMSNYNTIEHNNASNNYGSGMFIGAKENTIRYNTVCDNRDGGLYYQDSVGGHGYGINLGRSDGSFDNYLHDNEICGNDYKDIYVVSGVTGNHGVNNTCDMTYNYNDTGTTGCTYPCAPGVCGNVDGLPGVTTNDGRQIFMYLLYGPEQYPLADPWAADCDGLCDGITTNDGRQIFMNLLYGEEEYPLVCC